MLYPISKESTMGADVRKSGRNCLRNESSRMSDDQPMNAAVLGDTGVETACWNVSETRR